MLKKLKSIILDDTFYIAILLVVVAVGSFGLGRLSLNTQVQDQSATVTLSTPPSTLKASSTDKALVATTSSSQPAPLAPSDVVDAAKNFVASKSGTKYHKITCAGAKQIKDTNKLFFATEEEAKASGYTRAANCKF